MVLSQSNTKTSRQEQTASTRYSQLRPTMDKMVLKGNVSSFPAKSLTAVTAILAAQMRKKIAKNTIFFFPECFSGGLISVLMRSSPQSAFACGWAHVFSALCSGVSWGTAPFGSVSDGNFLSFFSINQMLSTFTFIFAVSSAEILTSSVKTPGDLIGVFNIIFFFSIS